MVLFRKEFGGGAMNKFKPSADNIILAVTYVSILITGIIFKQPFYRILPLFISGIVMFLQSYANRYGYLLGGINAVIYTVDICILELMLPQYRGL